MSANGGDGNGNTGGAPGAPGDVTALADRFVDLACLSYADGESVERRREAEALLARAPELVRASVHAAAAVGDLEAVTAWLDRDPGLAIRASGPRSWPPLLSLCYSRVQPAAPGCDPLATAQLLLARDADPDAHVMLGQSRFTAITGAMGEGEAGPVGQPPHPQARALVELLLDHGADPDDSQGLYNTHFRPDDGWIELLLAHGLRTGKPASWNPQGPSSVDFLLGRAAVQGFAARVRLLLAHGGAIDGRDHYTKRTHLENALLWGHAEIAALLEQAGAAPAVLTPVETFRAACLRGDEAEARRLLAAHPEARAHAGTLIAAASHGRLEAVRLALDLGLPIDAAAHDGLTPLHHAARAGHPAVARELVARGASLEARDAVYGGRPVGHAEHFARGWPTPAREETLRFLTGSTAV